MPDSSIASNIIRVNDGCTTHTMHGNMVFSTHYILGTPQQSGGLLVHVCSVKVQFPCDSDIEVCGAL